MVMLAEPLHKTVAALLQADSAQQRPLITALSPQGEVLKQSKINALAQRARLVLICGRYEGIDQRFLDQCVDEQLSLGDYVLSGGELAAAVVIDAVLRQLPGVLGHADSAQQDSFSSETESDYALLDCPHYSRPEVWQGAAVPPVLLSGNHAAIKRWRRQQALLTSWRRRPDLLSRVRLTDADQALLTAALEDEKVAD